MVKKLIVADIAPISYAAHHDDVFAGLKAVNLDEALQRADVEKIIAQHVKENDTVQFLMKALYRKEDHSFGWRFNLDSIQHSYQNILGYVDNGEVYDGPTLFLRGDKSRYIQERDFSVMKKIFPNYELASLDAGHWLHAERPREFVEKVVAFLG
jgi:pimeloyl-ACP methyl ester carboxylesterase